MTHGISAITRQVRAMAESKPGMVLAFMTAGDCFWLAIFWGAHVKERIGGERAADIVGFDCMSHESVAHSHRIYSVRGSSKKGSKGT